MHSRICQSLGNGRVSWPVNKMFVWDKYGLKDDVIYKAYYEFACSRSGNNNAILKPIGYSFVIVGPDGKTFNRESYFGDNAITHFVHRAIHWINQINKIVSTTNIPVRLTAQQRAAHENAKHCEICKESFEEMKFRRGGHKVLDHPHQIQPTAQRPYRTLCQRCNTKVKTFKRQTKI